MEFDNESNRAGSVKAILEQLNINKIENKCGVSTSDATASETQNCK